MPAELNRRSFGRAAMATVTGAAISRSTIAEPPANAVKPSVEGDSQDTEGSAAQAVSEHLLQAIRARYPDPRLAGKPLPAIRRTLISYLKHGDELRHQPLTNADEPGFLFSAYRGDAIR